MDAPALTLKRTRKLRRKLMLQEVLLWERFRGGRLNGLQILRVGALGRRNRWCEPRSGFPARKFLNDEAIECVLVSIEQTAAPSTASRSPSPALRAREEPVGVTMCECRRV